MSGGQPVYRLDLPSPGIEPNDQGTVRRLQHFRHRALCGLVERGPEIDHLPHRNTTAQPIQMCDDCSRRFVGSRLDESARRRAAGHSDHNADHAGLQSAVPPFATDMYTGLPASDRRPATSASLVGLTLTTFFLGMALGQLLGDRCRTRRPADTDDRRRADLHLGAVGCALAPSIGLLIVFRVVQGFGGGVAGLSPGRSSWT